MNAFASEAGQLRNVEPWMTCQMADLEIFRKQSKS